MRRIETQLSYGWAYFKDHPNRQKKFKLGWCLDIQDLSADKMAHSPIEMTVWVGTSPRNLWIHNMFYNVRPPFNSWVGANNSNFTMVYGIYNIYNYSPWGLNQQTYQTSHLGAPHCHQRVGSEFIPWKPWLRHSQSNVWWVETNPV